MRSARRSRPSRSGRLPRTSPSRRRPGLRKAATMHDEMTIDDAINVANVEDDLLIDHADADVRELAIAAKRLVSHVGEQSREAERERARRKGLPQEDAGLVEGHRLEGRHRRRWPPRLSGGPCRARRTDALPPDVRRLACRSVRIEHAAQRARAVSALTGRPGGGGARGSPWSALRLAGRTAAEVNARRPVESMDEPESLSQMPAG